MRAFFAILTLVLSQSVLAFHGYIEYEVIPTPVPGATAILKIGMKQDLLRLDLIKEVKSQRETMLSTLVNYKTQLITQLSGGKEKKLYITRPCQAPVPGIEEVVNLNEKRKILEYDTLKHDQFYILNKKRYHVVMWFPLSLKHENFKPIDKFVDINKHMYAINFFFHPITHQIALELTYQRPDIGDVSYKAVKVVNDILKDEYFDIKPLEPKKAGQ